MKAVSAREAKHHFGQLIDEARDEPVVVVLAVEEYQRLTSMTVDPSSKKREDER